MATHSSILVWRIPWTEKLGRLYIVHVVAESDMTEVTQQSTALHSIRRPGKQIGKTNTRNWSNVLSKKNNIIIKLCAQSLSCVQLFTTPWTACSLPSSSVHGDSPGKRTGVGCHALFQRMFPTQGSNPGLLHCRWILYCLSRQGSP